MNKDIRIKTTFPTHYKTENLIAELGYPGYYSLTRLWCFAAEYKPKGVFSGMSMEDIARAAGWKDDPLVFLNALIKCRFVTRERDIFSLHDWSEHNRFVYFSDERSEKARKNVENRWKNTSRIPVVSNPDTGRIPTVYDTYTSAIETAKDTSIEKKFAEKNTTLSTPSPSPLPIPSPIPSPLHKKTSVAYDPISGKFLNLNGDMDYYKEQFPAVNVEAEIKAMEAWLFANPTNRKGNYRRFIVNWLKKAQDKARPKDPSKRKTWRDVI